jgi:hypothetical protein
MNRSRLRRRAVVGLTAALSLLTFAGAFAPAVATATTASITFSPQLDGCVGGTMPHPGGTEKVTWRDAGGHVIVSYTVTSDPYGHWFETPGVCAAHRIEAGDTITGKVTQPSTMQRTITVPSITGTFDRTNNVIEGRAPAGGTFGIYVADYLPGNTSQSRCQITPPRTAKGAFSVNTTNCDGLGYVADGADEAYLDWTDAQGDTTVRQLTAPYVRVMLGTAKIIGYALPGTTVHATLKNAGGTSIGSAQALAGSTGSFTLKVKNGGGAAVPIRAGERLSGDWAGFVHFVVPQATATGSGSTISGKCAPNAPYALVLVFRDHSTYNATATTDATGSTGDIDITFTGETVQSGDPISIVCQMPSGDRVGRATTIP